MLVFEGPVLSESAEALDALTGGAVSRATAERFKGAKGQAMELVAPAHLHAPRLLLIGCGSQEGFDAAAAETAGAEAFKAVKMSGSTALSCASTRSPSFWPVRPSAPNWHPIASTNT